MLTVKEIRWSVKLIQGEYKITYSSAVQNPDIFIWQVILTEIRTFLRHCKVSSLIGAPDEYIFVFTLGFLTRYSNSFDLLTDNSNESCNIKAVRSIHLPEQDYYLKSLITAIQSALVSYCLLPPTADQKISGSFVPSYRTETVSTSCGEIQFHWKWSHVDWYFKVKYISTNSDENFNENNL